MKSKNKITRTTIFLFCLIFFCQLQSYSQVSITQSEFMNMFTPGSVFHASESLSGMIDIGKAGGPNEYDFTSIDIQNLFTINNYSVSSLPVLAERFPFNAITFGNSPTEIMENPVFYQSGDSVFIAGYATIEEGFRFIHHVPFELYGKFPVTYGPIPFGQIINVFDTVYNANWQISSTYFYNDFRTTSVDGYGILKIQGAELECLRIRKDYSWFQYKEYFYITREGAMVIVSEVSNTQPDTGLVQGEKQILLSASYVPVEKDPERVPTEYLLSQNYPNPFNPATNIQYTIGSGQFVTLKVFDVLGNEIATLVNEEKPAGNYEVEFQSTAGSLQLASGMYFYQLRAGEFTQTKKMLLLK